MNRIYYDFVSGDRCCCDVTARRLLSNIPRRIDAYVSFPAIVHPCWPVKHSLANHDVCDAMMCGAKAAAAKAHTHTHSPQRPPTTIVVSLFSLFDLQPRSREATLPVFETATTASQHVAHPPRILPPLGTRHRAGGQSLRLFVSLHICTTRKAITVLLLYRARRDIWKASS